MNSESMRRKRQALGAPQGLMGQASVGRQVCLLDLHSPLHSEDTTHIVGHANCSSSACFYPRISPIREFSCNKALVAGHVSDVTNAMMIMLLV